MKMKIILILGIFLLGFFLRFYKLGVVPNSLSWDEASWGYNAYSILKTGMDEYGRFFPLSFEAFGDFKQPVYVYLTSLSIAIFDLNNFAVRFPSAILGSLSIPLVYLFVRELFRKEPYSVLLGLLSSFFFSISPWSIQFSRVAYEANVGLFFILAGVAISFRGLNKKNNLLLFGSTPFFIISGYSYHSQKIFTPILFIILLVLSYVIYKLKIKIIALLLVLFLFGSIFWIFDTRTTQRGRSVTFFANSTQILKTSTENIIQSQLNNDYLGTILNNRRIIFTEKYLENYLLHFYPNFLFTHGDNARHHAFGMGVLYIAELPLLLLGIIFLDKKRYFFILIWFLLAPVASAFAVDAPNASRSLVFLPTWQIFEALGVIYLLGLKRKRYIYLVSAFLLLNFLYFFHQYFTHTNPQYGVYWQDGYKESVLKAYEMSIEGKTVYMSDNYEQPYIFYLFHTKYDPIKYIQDGGSKRIKFPCFFIDTVNFGRCEPRPGSIYIDNGKPKLKNIKWVSDIKDSTGKTKAESYLYL